MCHRDRSQLCAAYAGTADCSSFLFMWWDPSDCLEKGTLYGAGHRPWVEKDPDLDPLRNHPRFAAILTRI